MVSHRAASAANGSTEEAVTAPGVRLKESVYQSSPIPPIPAIFTGQQRPLGDSMLMYTQRMRQISKLRTKASEGSSSLEVQALPIPKQCLIQKTEQQHRLPQGRPRSLDALIASKKQKSELGAAEAARTQRPLSDLQPPPRRHTDDGRITINFVTAADLFELVDFNLHEQKCRQGNLKLARAEENFQLVSEIYFLRNPRARYKSKVSTSKKKLDLDGGPEIGKDTRTASGSLVSCDWPHWAVQDNKAGDPDQFYRKLDADNPDMVEHHALTKQHAHPGLDRWLERLFPRQPQKLCYRPKRAKRMRLHRSVLSAIPEDGGERRGDMANTQESASPTRVDKLPTSCSLAAIKDSRKTDPEHLEHSKRDSASRHTVKQTDSLHKTRGLNSGSLHMVDKPLPLQYSRETRSHQVERMPRKKRSTAKERVSNASKGYLSSTAAGKSRISTQTGQETGLEHQNHPRTKANKKFKLLFLRDKSDSLT